mgnify:CR=1 FL=1
MLRLYKNVKVHISKEIKTLIGIFFFYQFFLNYSLPFSMY